MPEFVWVGGDVPLIPSARIATEPVIPPRPTSEPDPDNHAAFLDWLRAEAHRFNEYVSSQMTAIGNRRQELLAQESRLEAMLIARQQEINRQEVLIAAKIQSLSQREQAMQGREAAQVQSEETLAAREAVVLEREARASALTDTIAQLERREAELRAVIEELDARRAEAESLMAVARRERDALDKRRADLERAELAIQRREAELDEIEEQIRRELDERERELTLHKAGVAPAHVATVNEVRNGVPGRNGKHDDRAENEVTLARIPDFPRPTYSE